MDWRFSVVSEHAVSTEELAASEDDLIWAVAWALAV